MCSWAGIKYNIMILIVLKFVGVQISCKFRANFVQVNNMDLEYSIISITKLQLFLSGSYIVSLQAT
jgi:hypothetical protein